MAAVVGSTVVVVAADGDVVVADGGLADLELADVQAAGSSASVTATVTANLRRPLPMQGAFCHNMSRLHQ
jgi:hypothetical protein